MIYAVIDTNVLVSALISKQPQSATVKVVSGIFNGHIKPVYHYCPVKVDWSVFEIIEV